MQSRVHSVWQIQHQSKLQPALVQTMCMHPPARSVGVRHFGHGLVVTLIATFDASSHRASATLVGSTEYSQEPWLLIDCDSGKHSPMWNPCRQFLQKTNCERNLKLFEFIWTEFNSPRNHFGNGLLYSLHQRWCPCHNLAADTKHHPLEGRILLWRIVDTGRTVPLTVI